MSSLVSRSKNLSRPASNLAQQEQLYALRAKTQDAFNEAKTLEARWKELEKEQKEVYQVQLHALKLIKT